MILEVRNIFIILTPFQYKVMKFLFEDKLLSQRTVIFYSDVIVLDNTILEKAKCIRLNLDMFSFQNIKKQPIKYFFIYRKKINAIQKFIESSLLQLNLANELSIYIGTDKDNFTQIFLNKIYTYTGLDIKLIVIEEGSGFYRNENYTDRLKQIFYRIFTPILFNEKIEYHRQLGTDQRINEVYARLPELIPPHKNSHKVKYHKYGLLKLPVAKKVTGNSMLIYSFPNKNYPISDIQKKEILEDLITFLSQEDIVYVKPHPREDLNVIKSLDNVIILDPHNSGEEIDYFNYNKIVNFSSSIVIDLLASGYPNNRIYTINLDDSNLAFFKQTKYINILDIKNLAIEDQAK